MQLLNFERLRHIRKTSYSATETMQSPMKLIYLDQNNLLLMKFILTIIWIVGGYFSGLTQNDSTRVQPLTDKQIRQLVFAHSGMGFSMTFPNFGKSVENITPWRAFNINYAFIDFNWGYSKNHYLSQYIDPSDQPYDFDAGIEGFSPDEIRYGRWVSIGAQVPIPMWSLGKARSYGSTWWLMPSIGMHFGGYKFWSQYGGSKEREDSYSYLSLTPGIRLQAPFVTADFNLDFCGAISDNPHLRKWGISGMIVPRLTLRADGLLTLFNPKASYFNYTTVEVTSSSTTTNTYRSGNLLITETTTSYTGTAHPGTAAFMDIGPFIGIGPKISFQPNSFEAHSVPSRFFGLAIHGRGGPISMGLNIEGGRLGHASRMKSKVEEGDKYWKFKSVDRNSSFGKGSMGVVQAYFDVGIELNSLILAMFGMYINERGSGTPYFAISAGYSFGGYGVFNQQFESGSTPSYYQNLTPEENVHYNNPAKSKGGYLGGWYACADIGALQFRYESFRYRRAPLASTHMISLAYRLPATLK